MIPARLAPILFGLILSGLMSLIVAGIATYRSIGLTPDFVPVWSGSWLASWLVAFPTVLIVAPFTRNVVSKLVRSD